MSQEISKLISKLDLKDIHIQLALQCAPFIMGLKISNLLVIPNEHVDGLMRLLKNADIFYSILLVTGEKTTLLLYKPKQLERYFKDKRVRRLLYKLGYTQFGLAQLLNVFKERYIACRMSGENFPHEMGLFLGYPVEDVEGFIQNNGENFLYTGYWKVYENAAEKAALFERFERAKEILIINIANGRRMEDIYL